MKLSNKLLIGFVGFILLYLIVAFTELRFRGDDHNFNDENAQVETLALTGIKNINISNLGRGITMSASRDPHIEIRSKNGGLLSAVEYTILDSTLNLTGFEAEEAYDFTIYIPSAGLSEIVVDNTHINMRDLNLQSLSLKLIDGNVSMYSNIVIENLSINAIDDSNFSTNKANIDNVLMQLNDSRAYFYNPLKKLEGSISEKSSVMIYGSGEIQLKKDKSSTVGWYQSDR